MASKWSRAGWLAVACVLGVAPAGHAFEFVDGRLQIHGFGEVQLRTLNNNFSDDWDLAQWYNVLNVEIEYDILPAGWGPIIAMSAFTRLEVRYDCVWTRACGLAPSADLFGDRANQGPHWMSTGRDSPFVGVAVARSRRGARAVPDDRAVDMSPFRGFERLFRVRGADLIAGANPNTGVTDDPAPYLFNDFFSLNGAKGPLNSGDYAFFSREVKSSEAGQGFQILGPWLPRNTIRSIGSLKTHPDPFNPGEPQPALAASAGADLIPATGDEPSPFPQAGNANYPFRPLADFLAADRAPGTEARGVYFPSPGLRRLLLSGEPLSKFDQNFRQEELAWNRGASQQDEKEFKEAYLDVEFFDGRLWLRLGKQTLVWGKTELFRSQDQFNPQDLALATLPSLEESRIGLWAARATWAFYEIGPLEDVRLELAVLTDQFEPADLGRCGEPYAPLPVCNKAFGLWVHGLTGAAAAGEIRPPSPWNSSRGVEAGFRLEWRWQRFSFALTDFYGFEDLPFVDPIYNYERNVDPLTGRPRRANSRGRCDPDGLFGPANLSACLPGDLASFPAADPTIPATSRLKVDNNAAVQKEIRENHYGNLGLFRMICAGTLGFLGDAIPGGESECSLGVFGSQTEFLAPGLKIATLISLALGGGDPLTIGALANAVTGIPFPIVQQVYRTVPLSINDLNNSPTPVAPGTFPGTFNDALTAEQRALLGCGPFFGTSCDVEGIDLMNAEASALMQAFAGFEGTPLRGFTTMTGPQPGTLFRDSATGNLVDDFGLGAPYVCTRVVSGGNVIVLPGCRAGSSNRPVGLPGRDPAWLEAFDGNPIFDGPAGRLTPFTTIYGCAVAAGDDLVHPWTCGPAGNRVFVSEMAALSWNFLQLLVVFSSDDERDGVYEEDELDLSAPITVAKLTAPDRCSFASPQFCSTVRDLFNVSGNRRRDVRAGGNGEFGRRDFLWHGTQELVLRYKKRNVLGLAMDFAEDVTKTNWGLEFTWIEDLPLSDANSTDGFTEVDQYRLTVSVDRPTFINFLNANRTFFINSQIFVSYTASYTQAFQANGPWNVLATLTAFTGYFQDRLMGALTLVYDVKSTSGGVLPRVSYRFTEDFSAEFGLLVFFGGWQAKHQFRVPQPVVTRNVGSDSYKNFVENGLAVVKQRDEAFLRIRYSF